MIRPSPLNWDEKVTTEDLLSAPQLRHLVELPLRKLPRYRFVQLIKGKRSFSTANRCRGGKREGAMEIAIEQCVSSCLSVTTGAHKHFRNIGRNSIGRLPESVVFRGDSAPDSGPAIDFEEPMETEYSEVSLERPPVIKT